MKTGRSVKYTAGDLQNPANEMFICELLRDTYTNVSIIPYVFLVLDTLRNLDRMKIIF